MANGEPLVLLGRGVFSVERFDVNGYALCDLRTGKDAR
jgi:hypothetical protein